MLFFAAEVSVPSALQAQDDWAKGVFRSIDRRIDFKPKTAFFVRRTLAAPAVDGELNDAVWGKANKINGLSSGTAQPRGRTEILVTADAQNLYLACKCYEPEMNRIRSDVKPVAKRNIPVWRDDSVELFIDPTGGAGKHYQFIINSAGALYYAENNGRGLEWKAELQAAAHVNKDFWSAELVVPFEAIGLDGSRSDIAVKMQFCRTATRRSEMTSWRPGWNDPKHFAPVVIDRKATAAPTIEELSLGNLCPGTNNLRIRLRNFPKGIYEARLALDQKPMGNLRLTGNEGTTELPYILDRENRKVEAEMIVVRKDTTPEKVIDSVKGTFFVPLGLTLSFRNAHISENGKTRLWVRVLAGDAETIRLRATVSDAHSKPIRSFDLPDLPGGAGQGWFDFSPTGLPAGRYSLRVESPHVPSTATATFHVERIVLPERATIPVSVDEPVGREWQSFPATFGVPFPHATLDSADHVRLVDRNGKEVPSQITATSSWNADRRDVRWLMVDFLASSTMDKGGEYRVEFGRNVKRSPVTQRVKVTETGEVVAVDTGPLRLVIDKRKATILREVLRQGVQVIAGQDGGTFLQNQDRKLFCSAWDREPPKISVEETGPVRAVVRQQGWYTAKDGERLCRYDIRIHMFAGQQFVRVLHTWVLTHDSRKVRFGDISIRFPLQGGVKRFAFGVDDAYESSPFEGNFGNSERVSLVQEDFDRFAIRDWQGEKASVLKTGKRSGGWAMANTGQHSVLVHLRDLWQHYPAELEIARDSFAVHFWPEHGFSFKFRERPASYGVHRWPYTDGPFMDLQPREYVEQVLMKDKEKIHGYDRINALGMSKTQEVWLDFGLPSRTAAQAQESAHKYEQPLAARADPQWIADARVFRPFRAADSKTFPAIEEKIRARWESNSYLQDRSHDYGWLHYGDRHSQSYPYGPAAKFGSVHRYWLVSDYRCGMEPWLLWARSGERLYFQWAEMLSRHVMDVDIIHWTGDDVGPPRRKGQFYPMSFAHYCSRPTSMSLHNDPIGFNMMYYYLTGYRRALDVLLASGERELDSDLALSNMHRGHAVTGHNQLDMYRITWDERYWENAFKAINKGLDAMLARSYLDPTYVYEWLHDIEDFTGDSRLRAAVLNIADNIIGKPLGTKNSYPALYVFGHAYELTGDPKYIAWGKGKLEMHASSMNLSADPELRGRVTNGDQVHFTRLMRQVPGFLHYQALAESRHGSIERRTQPILFLYERGPVYFREDEDRDFLIRLHLSFRGSKKVKGHVKVTAPDGKVAIQRNVRSSEMRSLGYKVDLPVPRDGQTGTYRLDINVPTEGGDVQGQWGVESPDLGKVACRLSKFTFWGGHVFFYVPKGVESFRLRITPRRFAALYGQPVVLGPDGQEYMRLDGMNPEWITIRPKPDQTDSVWGAILFHVGVFEMEGLPPFVYGDPSESFVPQLGPVKE